LINELLTIHDAFLFRKKVSMSSHLYYSIIHMVMRIDRLEIKSSLKVLRNFLAYVLCFCFT
jgi:hypothetical protein